MGLKRLLLFLGLACLVAQGFLAGAVSKDESSVVNLMIDMERSPEAAGKTIAEKENLEMNSTINLANEVDSKNLNVTIFVTGDIASKYYPLYVTLLGSKSNHELALGGMSRDDAQVSFDEQDARLRKTKRLVEEDYVCGGYQFKAAGYKPQLNSFNQSAYKVMDDIGLMYLVDDTGIPESTGKSWPYLLENHTFYVVPVSISGSVRLWDTSARDAGMNGTQWYDILVSRFDESGTNGEPLVAIFTNTVSGSGDYLNAYKKFVEYAASKNATFVMSKQLVEMAKTR